MTTLFGETVQSPYIVGKVAAIFFENPSNFYKVMLVTIVETSTDFLEKEIVVTGSFGEIQEAEVYRFFGDFVEHPRYGKQFQVSQYQQEKPTSFAGMVHYFSSDKFPGVGKKTAEKIVAALGEESIDYLLLHPELLKQVTGLSAKKQTLILDTLRANHGMEQVLLGLNQYGFGSQLAFSIYQTYKEETLSVLQENPYQLVEDIEGIGFKRADQLAEQLGIEAQATQRIRAAILHEVLQHALRSGDTYIEKAPLIAAVAETLEKSRPIEIALDQIAEALTELIVQGKVQAAENKIFENSLYFSEQGISQSLQRLLARKETISYEKAAIEAGLRKIEQKFAIQYGSSQRQAMQEAIRAPLFILTGGPGTGKTTVINGIVSLFAELNALSLDVKAYTQAIFPILLAAPTGRAAKRMQEATGLPAGTIHRLLGLTGREKAPLDHDFELEGGLLIVDEMSMVDTWLANTLFKAVPTNMQVILVGDKDQLPSVGPGQVLHDLLQSKRIPQYELTEIYRQETTSTIIPLAHQISRGIVPQDLTENKKDRSFFTSDSLHIEKYVRQIVTKAKEKNFSAQDIQLLAPMYRGTAGINALNKMMQEIFNPPAQDKKEVHWNDAVYRIGDKVLQLVNTPEFNVFNGDMGEIVGIILAKDSEHKVDELVIQFDAIEVRYLRNEWQKITLSYCCSIHKAQGSEFKMVILPMVQQYHRMLQRNLLYTAVTRSRELLILLGEPKAFVTCIQHEATARRTTLTQRLAADADPYVLPKESLSSADLIEETPENYQSMPEKAYVLTASLIAQQAIDPMIGMEKIKPEMFL